MDLTVELIYQTDERLTPQQEQMLYRLLEEAARLENRKGGEVAITLCDDRYIQELNRQFRHMDRPTDVLSFPMEDEELLGDIVISLPKAKAQAEEYGHSFERELGFLAVHGFLHLLGYDHDTPEAEREMFSKQEEILLKLGLSR